MRYLALALLSVLLFFPIYIGLHPILGPDWAAGVAALFMYVLLPILLLWIFPTEWRHPLVKAGNYLIAFGVLWITLKAVQQAFEDGEREFEALRFFWIFGVAALYYIAFGRMRGSETDEDEAGDQRRKHGH